MSTNTQDPSKPKSVYVEEAVQLAAEAQWEEAIELNKFMIETFGPDEACHNRIGKALTELGRLEEAKVAYDKALALNPQNLVARKNTQRLENLMKAHQGVRAGAVKVDLNLFVEEMGKTTTTNLRSTDVDVCSKIAPGDVAELRVEGDGVEVDTIRGVRIGALEAKLARRLLKFIQGGNRYQAGVTSCDAGVVKVIVREVYQDPKFAGKPSFPITRKRDVEFRPYAREALVTRDSRPFISDDDDDDSDNEPSAEVDEGLHDVDEDENSDFEDDEVDSDGDDGEDDE
ncbi:MAG TPA: tetratricopeptide repeat protein [Candidatus Dormibacteraeota bacterium]|nr:tetratricopeptide repeat protein [Candidatus Dormibacteraeota bacterium]